ncbi:hypothetical protein Tco_1023675 [Tanacetum coccineum]
MNSTKSKRSDVGSQPSHGKEKRWGLEDVCDLHRHKQSMPQRLLPHESDIREKDKNQGQNRQNQARKRKEREAKAKSQVKANTTSRTEVAIMPYITLGAISAKP